MKKLPTKIACYDSGFGLSVCPFLGEEEVSTVHMVQSRFFKLQLPKDGDTWDQEFDTQKELINAMVAAYNEKMERERKNEIVAEILKGSEEYADGETTVFECIEAYCLDHGYSEVIMDAAYAKEIRSSALAAGIPASVIDGKTDLKDHFSQDYINYKCNKETK